MFNVVHTQVGGRLTRFLGAFIFFVLVGWSCNPRALAQTPPKALEIGIMPYLSPHALLVTYEPMRAYLAKQLGRRVDIYTAPDFKTFTENTLRGEYDLIIAVSHLVRLAQKEAGYSPQLGYGYQGSGNISSLLIVHRNSEIRSLQELRGKWVVIPDRMAIVTIAGLEWLRKQGMTPQVDFRLIQTVSHNTALLTVQRGEASAAITTSGVLKQVPDELRNSVKPLALISELRGLIFATGPHLTETSKNAIKAALLQFAQESIEGKTFLKSTGFNSLLPVSESEMKLLDPYLLETKRLLRETLLDVAAR